MSEGIFRVGLGEGLLARFLFCLPRKRGWGRGWRSCFSRVRLCVECSMETGVGRGRATSMSKVLKIERKENLFYRPLFFRAVRFLLVGSTPINFSTTKDQQQKNEGWRARSQPSLSAVDCCLEEFRSLLLIPCIPFSF